MGSPVLNSASTLNCGHGGMVNITATQTRVKVSGQAALTVDDMFTPSGCPLNIASAPSPCVSLRWVVPATRVKVGGRPVLTSTSTAMSIGPTQAPQGAPIVISVQPRVSAT